MLIQDILDELAATQAIIDQARAHLAVNADKLTTEQVAAVSLHLDSRQEKLDWARNCINKLYPRKN